MSSGVELSNDHNDSDGEIGDIDGSDDSGSDRSAAQRKTLRVFTDSSDDNSETVQNSNDSFVQNPNTKNFTDTSNVYFENTEPQNVPPSDSKAIVYFDLFFTASLLEIMAEETNRYAEQYLNSVSLKKKSRARSWTPTSALEMKAFIAVLLEMGITRRPTIYSYWLNNSRSIPWFQKMFKRDRFMLLLRFFHLVDNKTLLPPSDPNYNPCAKFEPLVNHANTVFRSHYASHEQHFTDESSANQVLMCALRDTKSERHPAYLISINADKRVKKQEVKYEPIEEKPSSVVDDYNTFMGGIDKSDKMLYAHLDEHKTLQYWKKVAFNIFGRMVLNAYALYTSNVTNGKMCRLNFTTEIIDHIEKEWRLQKDAMESLPSSSREFALEKLPGLNQRKCVVCSIKSGMKRSRLVCSRCKKGLHGICAHKHYC